MFAYLIEGLLLALGVLAAIAVSIITWSWLWGLLILLVTLGAAYLLIIRRPAKILETEAAPKGRPAKSKIREKRPTTI